jgi:uncharacterized protein YceK
LDLGIRGIPASPESHPGFVQRAAAVITGVLDLPISLVTDTVLIPEDLRRVREMNYK